MRPTIARSRTSAPADSARGIHTVSAERFALVEQPKRQKPRYMQGDDLPCGALCGADTVASGVSVQPMPIASQPRASSLAALFISCARYG